MRTKLHLMLAFLWLTPALCFSADSLPDPGNLHQDPAWHKLLHYQPKVFGGTDSFKGQADDDGFYLSEQGKTSPEAELNATLRAILQPGGGDQHARCRFPARDRWLRENLDLPDSTTNCPAYDEWAEELNTETVTLVFAASYLNSPSSMFGHTFLRLDPPQEDEETNLLLASTVSYAADAAAHDSELLFAYKGIFGGYPGITTIQPYYEKIRLYSDIEHRDLWEYSLNLNPSEVDMLLAHTWEIRDHNFDYYFFDENCAYRLLALIDAARPGTDLLGEVSTHAIPSDTVRWVLDKHHYRPSAATEVSYAIDTLPEDHQTLAAAIAGGYIKPDGPEVQALPDEQRARLFDATYDYIRYQSEAEGWPREIAAPLSHSLLRQRSQIQDVPASAGPPTPAVRDDQGHDTFRASISGGQLGDRNFTELTFRPAYHDVLDPPAGYRPGAQLQFLRLDARLYTDNNEVQLEQLVGVEIRSLSPRDAFFSPLSWQVGFGARRTDTPSKRVLSPYLDGGAGGSWQLSDNAQVFAMATGDLEIDDDFRRGYDAAPGADLGLLYQHGQASLLAGIKTKAWIVSTQHRQDQAYIEGNWHLGKNSSLFASFERQHHYDRYRSEWQTGLHVYF